MTELLEKAFEEASKLTELEQNTLARWLIDEIISERKWEKAFAESEDVLEKLGDEALAEYAAGKTKPLDVNQL
jgi:NurA-like 5'-3' nuclease